MNLNLKELGRLLKSCTVQVVCHGRDGREIWGSGLSAHGVVVTAAHNVPQDQASILFPQWAPFKGAFPRFLAHVQKKDEDADLAVLKPDLASLAWNSSLKLSARTPSTGEQLIVSGFPAGLPAFDQSGAIFIDEGEFLLTDDTDPSVVLRRWRVYVVESLLFKGHSGGPCVDLNGEIVGIVTQKRQDGIVVVRKAETISDLLDSAP